MKHVDQWASTFSLALACRLFALVLDIRQDLLCLLKVFLSSCSATCLILVD